MGNCISRKKGKIDPPKITKTIDKKRVREIIQKSLEVSSHKIKLADREYGLYSKDDLIRFLKYDDTDEYEYIKQGFDCDDFADVLKGREREWYRWHEKEAGSTFGIVWGDLRKDPEVKRGHAINYVILDTEELILIEPQTDKIVKLAENSNVWLIIG